MTILAAEALRLVGHLVIGQFLPGQAILRLGLVLAGWSISLASGVAAQNLSPLPEELAMASLITNHTQQARAFMQHHPVLQFVARRKAADMVARDYFAHTDPDGFAANFIAAQAGYKHPYVSSPTANSIESIGVRHQNNLSAAAAAQIVFDAWMNSAGHRSHVLGEVAGYAAQTYYAVGYAFDPAGPFGYSSHYFVFVSAPPDTNAVFGAYAEWRFARLTLTQMNALDDDFDQDRIPALLEYVFDLNPTVSNAPPRLTTRFNQASREFRLIAPFRPDLDPSLRFTLRGSTGGVWWTWNAVAHTRAGNEFVVPIGATARQQFLKLGVER